MTVRRIHIVGASGSGTSTLGHALAAARGLAHVDTDAFFWLPSDPPFQTPRPMPARLELLTQALDDAPAGWVISGSLVGWGDPLIPRMQLVIFLSLPAELRMQRLLARERQRYGAAALAPGGAMHETHVEFMAWNRAYDTAGLEQRSRAMHEAWLATLTCSVLRLDSTATADELLAQIPSRE